LFVLFRLYLSGEKMISYISPSDIALAEYISHEMYRHPCKSFDEKKWTLPFLEGLLEGRGIPFTRIPVENGRTYGLRVQIVGEKEGKDKPGVSVLFRGDMDALPIRPREDVDVDEEFRNAFHGCGHHIHTAQAFVIMLWFHQNRDKFHGTVTVMFQPAEELPPGGCKDMMAYMVNDLGDRYDAAVMYHVYPDLPAGKFAVRKGPITASFDTFRVRVIGKSGHSGHPDKARNPLPISAELQLMFHQIFNGGLRPYWKDIYPDLYTWVESLGLTASKFCAVITKSLCGEVDVENPDHHTAVNVISDHAIFNGSIRCHDPAVRDVLKMLIRELPSKFLTHYPPDYQVRVTIEEGYPASYCDEHLVDLFSTVVTDRYGAEMCEEAPLSNGGEDFAYAKLYSRMLIVRQGVGFPDRPITSLHSRNAEFNEVAIPFGMETMIEFLLRVLDQ
jgi:metal-dependent amidase/aminoacylase/carboxypeptidase family protein